MTQFLEYVKMAVDNIRANKGRSFLTMLGIIIGIASVVTVVSIGNGLKKQVIDANNSQKNMFTIQPNPDEIVDANVITLDDLDSLHDTLDSSVRSIYSTNMTSGKITTKKGSYDAYITLTVPDYEKAENTQPVAKGRYFTAAETMNASPVCVIDELSAIYLFGNTDVTGMSFEVNVDNKFVELTIVGIRKTSEEMKKAESQYEMIGLDRTVNVLEVPFTLASSLGSPTTNFSSVTITAKEPDDIPRLSKAATRLLNARHSDLGDKAFTQQRALDFTNLIGPVMDAVTAFVALVAGISLVVGGIGVMNIMLVSVTERTREIGIRKSLGAKTGSIIAQFLCESAIISGMGGVFGIIIGGIVTAVISALKVGGIKASLSLPAVIVATLFSCGVGIVFGIYPARKAAKLSPIEALRRM